MTDGKSTWLTWVMVGCALAMTFHTLRPKKGTGPVDRKIPAQQWQSVRTAGQLLNGVDRQADIVVFSDFQCPACQAFAEIDLPRIVRAFPDVVVRFRHWPLTMHPYAYAAGRAAECFAGQSDFRAIHDVLFSKQGMIGTKSFAEFAAEAGVPDAKKFDSCLVDTAKVPVIEEGIAQAIAIGGIGTPVVLINGTYMLETPLDTVKYIERVRKLLQR